MRFSAEFFRHISTNIDHTFLEGMIADLPDVMMERGLNTPLRIAHFFGQTAEETGGWRWFTELGNRSYFSRYDGRRDSGNTEPGDGYRFRGRGALQITGRANFSIMGKELGIDLINHPELLSTPKYAFEVAAVYWNKHNLSAYADADDIITITKRINGGLNGLADRRLYTQRAKWSVDHFNPLV